METGDDIDAPFEPVDYLREHARQIWQRVMQNNIFYLLSALLMLIGCYLVCLPYLFKFKILGGLTTLLGVINLYEIIVIFTCGFLMRRMPRSGETSTLLLVELLFLLDITFTVNGCVPINYYWGLVITSLSLLLVFVKLYAIEAGAKMQVFSGIKVVLVPALIFVYSFQSLMPVRVGVQHQAMTELTVFMLWTAFAMLPLMILFADFRALCEVDVDDAIPSPVPWWLTTSFKKTVVAITLLIAFAQLVAQSWVYHTPISVHHFMPLMLALVASFPAFLNRRNSTGVDIALIAISYLFLFSSSSREPIYTWQIAGEKLFISVWRIQAVFAAVLFFTVWCRHRRALLLDAAVAAACMLIAAYDLQSLSDFMARPTLLRLLSMAPLLLFWLYFRRNYYLAVAAFSLQLLLVLRAALPGDERVLINFLYLCYWPVLAYGLSLLLKFENRLWTFFLLATVFVLGIAGYSMDSVPTMAYFVVASVMLATAVRLFGRAHFGIMLAYLGSAAVLRFRGEIPPIGGLNWGWLMIVLAFGVFGLAFFITQKTLRETEKDLA